MPPTKLSQFLIDNNLQYLAAVGPGPEEVYNDFGRYDALASTFGEPATWAILVEEYPGNVAVTTWRRKAGVLPESYHAWMVEAERLSRCIGNGRLRAWWPSSPYGSTVPFETFTAMRISPWEFVSLFHLGLLS